jgi:transcriptional regulator with XRE-family HTH domain
MRRSPCTLQISYRRFEERRKALGLSVCDVAREAQLHASTLYALVRPPSVKVRRRLCAVLGLEERELFVSLAKETP